MNLKEKERKKFIGFINDQISSLCDDIEDAGRSIEGLKHRVYALLESKFHIQLPNDVIIYE